MSVYLQQEWLLGLQRNNWDGDQPFFLDPAGERQPLYVPIIQRPAPDGEHPWRARVYALVGGETRWEAWLRAVQQAERVVETYGLRQVGGQGGNDIDVFWVGDPPKPYEYQGEVLLVLHVHIAKPTIM